MIAAFDVHYSSQGPARAAAVLFSAWEAAAPEVILSRRVPKPAEYIPGAFYKRELPCLLALLDRFETPPSVMIIDGYVRMGIRPGLGQHLFEALEGRIPVIGVAKSGFPGAAAQSLFRGGSRRPLYITAAGMQFHTAAAHIARMHGPYRMPTLLRQVDRIARGSAMPDGNDDAQRQ